MLATIRKDTLWISVWAALTPVFVIWLRKVELASAPAIVDLVEVAASAGPLYLRYAPSGLRQRYEPSALLIGFAGSLMTASKFTVLVVQGFCSGYDSNEWRIPMPRTLAISAWATISILVLINLGQTIKTILQESPTFRASTPSPWIATVAEKPIPSPSAGDDVSDRHPATLPLTFQPRGLSVLIVGSNRLAATRASAFLEAEANVIVTSSLPPFEVAKEVRELHEAGKISYLHVQRPDTSCAWAETMIENKVSLACVTDTLISTSNRRSLSSASIISSTCTSLRIPVNISDHPNLSTFTFPSTHRFKGFSSKAGKGNLVVAVSTNGQGCRMSGRVKREIVGRLGEEVGMAVDNVGRLRAKAKAKARVSAVRLSEEDDSPLNTPVPQLPTPSHSRSVSPTRSETKEGLSEEEQQLRRMRWVYQMSEYYSFEHLARMTEQEMDDALEMWRSEGNLTHHDGASSSSSDNGERGRILLIGSGPGHPGLLTMAAHTALKTATLILSDKLVPSEILALIPSTTKLHIAKKFPGNAEGAQNEMMQLALEGAQRGEVVVRLKQGDPFVYGRGGEEVLFFREHDFESTVIPGISSALAAPLMMGIPVTQRGVAESLVMCTGVGRQGKAVQLPGYVKSRSLIMLMGVARISQIISVLTSADSPGRDGRQYPPHLPIAVIERASSPDQRVILSTLNNIESALKELDERPPGMMLVGWAALALEGKGRVDILDRPEEDEEGIVKDWLAEGSDGRGWKFREGLNDEWRGVLNGVI